MHLDQRAAEHDRSVVHERQPPDSTVDVLSGSEPARRACWPAGTPRPTTSAGANDLQHPRTSRVVTASAGPSNSEPTTPRLETAATSVESDATRHPAFEANSVPSKRPFIEIDDSDDDLSENERLISQSAAVRAGPADARRVKQKTQENFLTSQTVGAAKGPTPVPSLESMLDEADAMSKKAEKRSNRAAVIQPPPIPLHNPNTGEKYTKGERKALRKEQASALAAGREPQGLLPGPLAFKFGQQATVPHDMHGTRNRARKMFPLETLGGYMAVNFRGNLYYWKGNESFPGAACIDRDEDERLHVDDCIWSEKHQTAILGYAGPSSAEPRATTQLAIIKADEAVVDVITAVYYYLRSADLLRQRHGEMTGLRREILDATPHDKLGITSLALVDHGGSNDLSFVSAGNDVSTVPPC